MSSTRNLAFQTLRHRDFRLLWAADSIAMLGTQMQRLAIIWQVYLLTERHGAAQRFYEHCGFRAAHRTGVMLKRIRPAP